MKQTLKNQIKIIFLILKLIYHVKCKFIEQYFIQRSNDQVNFDSVFKIKITNSKLDCAMQCFNFEQCWYFSFKDKECKLFDKLAKFLFKPSNQSFYYEKIKKGLEYYWPVHNSSVREIIQGVDLTDGVNVSFTEDRFGNPNSAISFNSGYYVFPNNYYFGGEITVMAWVRSRVITSSMRVIDFGNGSPMDNIVLSMSTGTSGRPYFEFCFSNQSSKAAISPEPINTYVWYHIAGVYRNNLMKIYVNGTQKANNTFLVKFGFRNNNYIGKHYPIIPEKFSATADYDDIKIYNRAFSDQEIKEHYENLYL